MLAKKQAAKGNKWLSLAAFVIQISVLHFIWIYSLLSVRPRLPGKFSFKMLHQTTLLFSYYKGPLAFPPHPPSSVPPLSSPSLPAYMIVQERALLFSPASGCNHDTLSHPKAQRHTCGCIICCWLYWLYTFRRTRAVRAAFKRNKCPNETFKKHDSKGASNTCRFCKRNIFVSVALLSLSHGSVTAMYWRIVDLIAKKTDIYNESFFA